MEFEFWWLLGFPLFFAFGWLAARIDIKQLVSESRAMPLSYFLSTTTLGIVLVVAGILALVYQGVTYTSRETVLDIGPIHATADRERRLPLPRVLGVVAVIGGVALVIAGTRTRAA